MFKKNIKVIEKLVLALFFVFATYIIFYQLGRSYLENWDEAWYGDIIRNMLRQKEFVVLYWNKMPLIDKPPFFMWIGAIISSVIGFSEFSIRLPSAISSLVIIFLITSYCYRNYGFVPSFLAFSSLALNNIFIWRARSGNIDSLVSLEILLTYFLFLSNKKYKYLLLGILFSIIYLTKASLVFFPIGIFLIHELIFKNRNLKKNIKNYFLLFSVFILISGTWLFLGSLKEGWGFAKYYLFRSDQGAASISFSNFKPDFIKYAYYSLQRRFFWVFLLGLILLAARIKKAKNFLLLSFSLLLIALLSFGKRDCNWYLVPSMPFWSITISFGTYKFINFFKDYTKTKVIVNLFIISLSLYVSCKTYFINIRSIMTSQTSLNQAKISSFLRDISEKNDKVVRLDHLYPTTIFYSERFVYSSDQTAETVGFFLSREDLIKKINQGEIKWVVGKNSEVEKFSLKLSKDKWQTVAVEGDELLLKVLF